MKTLHYPQEDPNPATLVRIFGAMIFALIQTAFVAGANYYASDFIFFWGEFYLGVAVAVAMFSFAAIRRSPAAFSIAAGVAAFYDSCTAMMSLSELLYPESSNRLLGAVAIGLVGTGFFACLAWVFWQGRNK